MKNNKNNNNNNNKKKTIKQMKGKNRKTSIAL